MRNAKPLCRSIATRQAEGGIPEDKELQQFAAPWCMDTEPQDPKFGALAGRGGHGSWRPGKACG